MKKVLWATITTILLFTIVIGEQIFVDDTLHKLIIKIDSLSISVNSVENIKNDDILNVCEDLDIFWAERETVRKDKELVLKAFRYLPPRVVGMPIQKSLWSNLHRLLNYRF